MKRIIVGAAAGLLLLVWQGSGLAAAVTGRCLACHTNDAVMKALHKPPAMEGGEAEG
jgi:mono/diheme cytochrome c family protein